MLKWKKKLFLFSVAFLFFREEWQRGGRGLVATEHREMDYRQNFNRVLIIYLLLWGKRLPVHNTLLDNPYSRCIFAYICVCVCVCVMCDVPYLSQGYNWQVAERMTPRSSFIHILEKSPSVKAISQRKRWGASCLEAALRQHEKGTYSDYRLWRESDKWQSGRKREPVCLIEAEWGKLWSAEAPVH